jgi:hypothetical protein
MSDHEALTMPNFSYDKIAKAMYDAFDADGTYVGEYNFGGDTTCLDGNFNLLAIAKIVTHHVLAEYLNKPLLE